MEPLDVAIRLGVMLEPDDQVELQRLCELLGDVSEEDAIRAAIRANITVLEQAAALLLSGDAVRARLGRPTVGDVGDDGLAAIPRHGDHAEA